VRRTQVLVLACTLACAGAVGSASARDSIRYGAGAPGRTEAAPTTSTVWFGGTHWDLADGRWEANASAEPADAWTFDSGVDGNWEG
jgi:hypothetical protein